MAYSYEEWKKRQKNRTKPSVSAPIFSEFKANYERNNPPVERPKSERWQSLYEFRYNQQAPKSEKARDADADRFAARYSPRNSDGSLKSTSPKDLANEHDAQAPKSQKAKDADADRFAGRYTSEQNQSSDKMKNADADRFAGRYSAEATNPEKYKRPAPVTPKKPVEVRTTHRSGSQSQFTNYVDIPDVQSKKEDKPSILSRVFENAKTQLDKPDFHERQLEMEHGGESDMIKGFFQPDNVNDTYSEKSGAGLRLGIGNTVESVSSTMRWLQSKTIPFGDKVPNLGAAAVQKVADGIKHGFEDEQQEFELEDWNDLDYLSSAVPQALPQLLTSILPGLGVASLTGKISKVQKLPKLLRTIIENGAGAGAQATIDSSLEAGGVFDEAIRRGYSEDEARMMANEAFNKNFLLNSGTSFAEMLLIRSKLGKGFAGLNKGTQVGLRTAGGAVTEGLQEGTQEAISASALGDDFSWTDPSTVEAMLLGGILGGGVTGSITGFKEVKDAMTKAPTIDSPTVEVIERSLNELPPEIRQEFDEAVTELEGRDIPREEALEIVTEQLLERTPAFGDIIAAKTKEYIADKKLEQQSVDTNPVLKEQQLQEELAQAQPPLEGEPPSLLNMEMNEQVPTVLPPPPPMPLAEPSEEIAHATSFLEDAVNQSGSITFNREDADAMYFNGSFGYDNEHNQEIKIQKGDGLISTRPIGEEIWTESGVAYTQENSNLQDEVNVPTQSETFVEPLNDVSEPIDVLVGDTVNLQGTRPETGYVVEAVDGDMVQVQTPNQKSIKVPKSRIANLLHSETQEAELEQQLEQQIPLETIAFEQQIPQETTTSEQQIPNEVTISEQQIPQEVEQTPQLDQSDKLAKEYQSKIRKAAKDAGINLKDSVTFVEGMMKDEITSSLLESHNIKNAESAFVAGKSVVSKDNNSLNIDVQLSRVQIGEPITQEVIHEFAEVWLEVWKQGNKTQYNQAVSFLKAKGMNEARAEEMLAEILTDYTISNQLPKVITENSVHNKFFGKIVDKFKHWVQDTLKRISYYRNEVWDQLSPEIQEQAKLFEEGKWKEAFANIKDSEFDSIERYALKKTKGIGKKIGSTIYVHKSAINLLDADAQSRINEITVPKDFGEYEVIKYDKKTNNVSFIKSPDWDTKDEPTVGDSIMFKADDTHNITKGRKTNQQIYHHKWMMVAEDYKGFDVAESKKRSEQWENSDIDFDRKKIGNSDYWNETVASKLDKPKSSVVEPTSDLWKRGPNFAEVKEMYPKLFEANPDEDTTDRHPTQIATTVSTYNQFFDYLESEGFTGTILDASSGLGKGTKAGQERGLKVDDVEPFPDKDYSPKFTSYQDIKEQYDVVISNAVLNVLPQDFRDGISAEIGRLLKDGGRAFINVRGRDVEGAKGKKSVNEFNASHDNNMEYFIEGKNSFQKGFNKKELVAYLQDVLSTIDGNFEVIPMSKKNSGFNATVGAVVTRKDGAKYSIKELGSDPILADYEKYFGKKQAILENTKGDYTITKDKHTKTGADIWIVQQQGPRLEKEAYVELAKQMKSLGGYYSKFKKGFIFKKDPTDKLNGKVSTEVVEKSEKVVEQSGHRSPTRIAERLRGTAKGMQKTIDSKRNDNRLTNTHKRATEDAHARNEADKLERLQGIMNRIADAIESGEATFLNNVTAKTHIEVLDRIVSSIKRGRSAEHLTPIEREKIEKQPISDAEINALTMPKVNLYWENVQRLLEAMAGTKGMKRSIDRIMKDVKAAKAASNHLIDGGPIREEMLKIVELAIKTNNKEKYHAESIKDRYGDLKRLESMKLDTSESLRSGIREYIKYAETIVENTEQKLKNEKRKKEAELSKLNITGFFPTPTKVIDRMIEESDIESGMTVLEPSAGKGNIAERIREEHKDITLDVVEFNNTLHDYLKSQDFNVVGEDFLKFEGNYDRIIMNPPFEKGQDIDHVQHAYNLLKPGGRVVAIMSEGPFFRGDKKATGFREWLEENGGVSDKLEGGSFKDSERSTGVATRMVTIDKPFENNRDTLIIERVGKEPFVVNRGDQVLEFTHPDKFTKVTVKSISQVKKQINGTDYGFFYPLDHKQEKKKEEVSTMSNNTKVTVPKKYQHMIKELFFEGGSDNHFVAHLNDGFEYDGSQTIIERNQKDLLDAIKHIELAELEKQEKHGTTGEAFTENGTKIEFEYRVVEVTDLIVSNDSTGKVNPNYPQELQPRDRSRKASQVQVQNIAQKLNPVLVGESAKASDGAPIVGPDMVVESGNGRTMAIQKMYEELYSPWQEYNEFLGKNADKLGLDKTAIHEMEYPILVRVRTNEVDRKKFVTEANVSSIAAMSTTEQAMVDAEKITEKLLREFFPGENGDLNVASNSGFMTGFLGSVASASERGRLVTAKGEYSQELISRVRNAIFAKAYGNAEAISILSESTDNNIRNITNAMLQSAPKFVSMKEGIKNGSLIDEDITQDIVDAMIQLSNLRKEGRSVQDFLNKPTLDLEFSDALTDAAKEMLNIFDHKVFKRSSKKLSELFAGYANELVEIKPNGLDLGIDQVTKAEILALAMKRVRADEVQVSLFETENENTNQTGTSEKEKPKAKIKPGQTELPPVTKRTIAHILVNGNDPTYNENISVGDDVYFDIGRTRFIGTVLEIPPADDPRGLAIIDTPSGRRTVIRNKLVATEPKASSKSSKNEEGFSRSKKDPGPPTDGTETSDSTRTDKTVTRSQIIDFVQTHFDVTVGVGKTSGRLGFYKNKFAIMRTKDYADFEVVFHELGHRIDQRIGLSRNSKVRDEFIKLAEHNLELPVSMTKDTRAKEGVAEYFRQVFYNENNLSNEAMKIKDLSPELRKIVSDGLTKQKWNKPTTELKNMTESWMNRDGEQELGGIYSPIGQKRKNKRTVKSIMHEIYTGIYNKDHPIWMAMRLIEKETGLQIDGNADAYARAVLTRGTVGRAATFVKGRTFDEHGRVTGESFEAILKEVDNIENFDKYLIAKHALHLKTEKGKHKTPITVEKIEEYLASAKPEYEALAERVYAYQQRALEVLVDGGLIDPKLPAKLKEKYPFYVPFYRVTTEDGMRDGPSGGGVREGQYVNNENGLKGMKEHGSTKNIISPIESIIKNTHLYFSLADHNSVGRALAEFANPNNPLAAEVTRTIIEAVPPDLRVTEIALEQIEKTLLNAGLEQEMTEELDMKAIAKIFEPIFRPNASKNEVMVWDEGKPKMFKIRDPLLYDALVAQDSRAINDIARYLFMPLEIANKALRQGITMSPFFTVITFARSAMQLGIKTEAKGWNYFKQPGRVIKAMKSVVKRDDALYDWWASGGAQSTFIATENDYLSQELEHLALNRKTKNMLKGKYKTSMKEKRELTFYMSKKALGSPFKMLNVFNDVLDQSIKLAEYQVVMKQTGGDRIKAALASREADLDFKRFGSKGMQFANRYWLFWNVAIQGPDNLMRYAAKNKVRFGMRGFMLVTLPTLVLYAINRDDEEYQELTTFEKDMYWNVPKGDGKFWKIKIPFEAGILFKTIPEKLYGEFLDYTRGENKQSMKDFRKNTTETMLVNFLPTLFDVAAEYLAERDLETGRDTVPMGVQSNNKPNEYDEKTSEIFKAVGKFLNRSPILLEHAYKSLTGQVGHFFLYSSDVALDKLGIVDRPDIKGLTNTTFLERQYTTSVNDGTTNAIETFYKEHARLKQDHEDNGVSGRPSPLLKAFGRANDDMIALRKVKKGMFYNHLVQPDGSPFPYDEKKRRVEIIDNALRDIARDVQGLEPLDQEGLEEAWKMANEYKDYVKYNNKVERDKYDEENK